MTTRMKLSDLVFDEELYPRTKVDSVNKTSITNAINAGEQLPPIVVSEGSHIIIDGVHRYLAYQTVLGKDAIVDVEVRAYASETDMILDAASLNARHGKRLSPLDFAYIIGKNRKKYRVSVSTLAAAFGMTESYLEKVISERFATNSDEPLKGMFRSLAGQEINDDQIVGNRKADGTYNAVSAINRVIEAFKADLIDLSREDVRERLAVLREFINDALADIEEEA